MLNSKWRQRLSSFPRAETGSATVEFTLWVPAFLVILLLGADATASFTRQSNFLNISQDTARIVSRHALDAEEGETFARNRARIGDYIPEVDVSIDERMQTVTVTVTANAREMAPFGILALALGDQVSVSVSRALEPI